MNHELLTVLGRATVHYQPIVDLNTGAITGFEAERLRYCPCRLGYWLGYCIADSY